MPARDRASRMNHPLVLLIEDYPWIHLGIGIAGNAAFLVGSVFFLYANLKTPGTWLFIAGSGGMLIGSLGEAVAKLARRRKSDA